MEKIAAPATLRLGPAPGLVAQVYKARRPLEGHDRALLLWLHGGSFTDGSLADSRDRSELLAEAGADVVALDYPLAPEHAFPASLTAAFQALQALATQPAKLTGSAHTALFVGGEEAGGKHAPALAGQLLVSPMLDPRLGSASMREGECGGCECHYAQGWKAYLGTCINADHPYAVPLNASRLGSLAPALVLSLAGHPLNDEARRYAAALRGHGGSAQDLTVPTLAPEQTLNPIHEFLREAARRALSLPE